MQTMLSFSIEPAKIAMSTTRKDQVAAWVRAQVEAAPPLTQEQAYRLKHLFDGILKVPVDRAGRIDRSRITLKRSA
jgi:hypothetical protein